MIIIGTFNIDTIETPVARRERIAGGSGTYCAVAASFFTNPKIVGVIGEDFPQKTIEYFKSKDIDIKGLQIESGKTFFWEGRYGEDPNIRTTIKTELNVLEQYKPQIPKEYELSDIVLLANIDPTLQQDILNQVKKPKLVAMDTMNFWIEKKKEALLKVLEQVDVFFANDQEIKLLHNEPNLIKAGKSIIEMGPEIIVVKKGEHGVLIFDKTSIFSIPAFPCECVVDPTGAGDCFAGGFLGYLDKGRKITRKGIRRAAVYGTVMASFAIENFGLERFESLSNSEIERRYGEFKKLVSF
ncbi:MAG: PfkB family carbohydrate kinase [Candidatus Aminicenantaceae bacterium]